METGNAIQVVYPTVSISRILPILLTGTYTSTKVGRTPLRYLHHGYGCCILLLLFIWCSMEKQLICDSKAQIKDATQKLAAITIPFQYLPFPWRHGHAKPFLVLLHAQSVSAVGNPQPHFGVRWPNLQAPQLLSREQKSFDAWMEFKSCRGVL